MFRVLGTVEAVGSGGAPVPLGDRRRALLSSLLARAGAVVAADELVDLVWGERPPADPAAALQSQVSRLRRALPGARIRTRPPGYVLEAGPDELDALRFDRLVAAARTGPRTEAVGLLDEALGLWRGRAYAEFAESPVARFEAIRLEQARLHAVEARHAALLDSDRAAESLPGLEAFVREHPLREQARGTLMRTLYALGRQAEALRVYDEYRVRLAEELGLEPSAAVQRLWLEILRHQVPTAARPPVPLHDLRARYVTTDGRAIAMATLGSGPPLVALPGWVSSIDVIRSGRDPRSSLLQRLVAGVCLTIYDRYGTGLSTGDVYDFGLEPSVTELAAVARAAGPPVSLLAMSQAGPVAIALAARHPELVDRLVCFGTYANGRTAFTRPELNAALVAMVRSHWGLGSRLFADLYRPGAGDEAAAHLAAVLRDSASREVAAGYLDAVYDIDVTELLPQVTAPALVLHYRGDRVVPFAGGLELAKGLPHASLVALDGRFHLPDARDLDAITATITDFLTPDAGW
ncbi:winged helix-turn-helix domain-containing protein [Micromonospora sp. CPCC 205371]|nr:winged helix-turn-helix domain-containing protein [Micromonospora sp. CPCC 205371]